MYKLPRNWIEKQLNESKCIQVACTFSNTCRWNYLTTSGQVCREEYQFIEDCDPTDPDDYHDTFNLPVMTWASVKRLQNALEKMYNN